MRRRFRLLRVAKWGGVVVCVFLFGVWFTSLWWEFGFRINRVQVVIVSSYTFFLDPLWPDDWYCKGNRTGIPPYGFLIPLISSKFVAIPVGIPFLLAAVATVALFRYDHPPSPATAPAATTCAAT